MGGGREEGGYRTEIIQYLTIANQLCDIWIILGYDPNTLPV